MSSLAYITNRTGSPVSIAYEKYNITLKSNQQDYIGEINQTFFFKKDTDNVIPLSVVPVRPSRKLPSDKYYRLPIFS